MELISEKEKRVFGALSKLGPLSIHGIAKETLINRTALYHTVDQLIKKGLVNRIEKDSGSVFQCITVEDFEQWSKRRVEYIQDETSKLSDWLRLQKQNPITLQSEVKFFEGVDAVKNLYDDSWRNNKEKVIYAITDYDKAYETLGQFMEKEYFPQRIKNGVFVKSLLSKKAKTAKTDILRSKNLLREMKFDDVFKELGIELNIYEDKISIVAFDREKPSAVLIKNKIISSAFKAIFNSLWKNATKN